MKNNQKGAVLLFVMVMLAVFLIISIGSMKSTASSISAVGNYTYRETGLAISDSLASEAKEFLTSADTKLAVAGKYSPLILPDTDGDGIPDAPCGGASGNWSCVPANTSDFASYSVQYFIERLCIVGGVITNTTAQCQIELPSLANGGSYSIRGGNQDTVKLAVYPILYRMSVKVTGPKDTVILAQTMLQGN
jgi:Tfp pilus assembly protein PilX